MVLLAYLGSLVAVLDLKRTRAYPDAIHFAGVRAAKSGPVVPAPCSLAVGKATEAVASTSLVVAVVAAVGDGTAAVDTIARSTASAAFTKSVLVINVAAVAAIAIAAAVAAFAAATAAFTVYLLV